MLYDIGFLLFSLFYLPTLIFKGKLHGDFLERFGVYADFKKQALASGKDRIWIQAVSVGEVALCKSLIPLLRERFPHNPIVLSTITKAGNDLAKKSFSENALVIYFPLDFSFIVRKVIGLIQPKVYIMVETEIWPNVLKEVARRKIHSVVINGRISDRSFGKYKLVKPFLKNTLKKITLFCMQSKTDAERIIHLGAPEERVKLTGNMKFDAEVSHDTHKAKEMTGLLGMTPGDELLVAGSTHSGEEEVIIEAYKKLLGEFPRLKLLIAPRHVERAADVEQVARKFGFEPVRMSQSHNTQYTLHNTPIFILDTIGHLKEAYSIATIVFVGGSLIGHGGQNPIEPAIFEKPIIFGPHMFNFKDIVKAIMDKEAAIEVYDKEDIVKKVRILLKDVEARRALGAKAHSVISENRGATNKSIEAVAGLVR